MTDDGRTRHDGRAGGGTPVDGASARGREGVPRRDAGEHQPRSDRLYRLLLGAYPAHYRARFGNGMRDTFQRDHARVRAAGGAAILPFWIATIVQAAWFGMRERARAASAYLGGTARADLRYAVRLLARAPLFTMTSVLSLAIGIAASTIVFGVADALFFRASPGVREGDRLVDIARTTSGSGYGPILYPVFRHVHEHARSLESVAAMTRTPIAIGLQQRGGSVRVYGQTVSGSFFDVLRMQPAIGRFFRAEEDDMSSPRAVVVVSHRFWRDHLHADPGVLARPLRLNDIPFDVVGVAAPGFDGTTIIGADLWIPMPMAGTLRDRRAATGEPGADWNDEWAIGRLAPGVTREAAQAELNALIAALKADAPAIPRSHGFVVEPAGVLPPRARPTFGAFVGLLGALAGGLLAIACSNVAGMLLVRADDRRHEIATRLALGASRGQVVGQLLVETLVLFVAGGVLALPLALWLAHALQTFLPPNMPIPIRFELDVTMRTVLFAIGTSLATALIFGLAPARHALRSNLSGMFNGRSATASRERRRLRHGLVVAQVALSLAMVITAGLFVRTLQAASEMDTGFRTANITVITIDTALVDATGSSAIPLVDRLVTRLRAVAGVEAVAHGRIVPLAGNSASLGAIRVPGNAAARLGGLDWDVISPNYFDVVGLPLVEGRTFTSDDRDGRPRVAIVNETFARASWPDRSAIGQRFRRVTGGRGERLPAADDGADGEPIEVVGVTRDAKYRSLSDPPRPFVYVPFAQHPQTRVELFVKHAPGLAIGRDASAAVASVEARLPIVVMRSFDEAAAITLTPQRFAAWMAGVIGSIGIFLAALGLYGVVAFLVARQTREIAIRMALGASHRDVRTAVLAQAARLAACGATLGLAIAWALGRLVQSQSLLLGVQPADPLTFGGLALLMSLVLFAASYLPARRAASTDPAAALRAQ